MRRVRLRVPGNERTRHRATRRRDERTSASRRWLGRRAVRRRSRSVLGRPGDARVLSRGARGREESRRDCRVFGPEDARASVGSPSDASRVVSGRGIVRVGAVRRGDDGRRDGRDAARIRRLNRRFDPRAPRPRGSRIDGRGDDTIGNARNVRRHRDARRVVKARGAPRRSNRTVNGRG